jgi:hypothetical protein
MRDKVCMCSFEYIDLLLTKRVGHLYGHDPNVQFCACRCRCYPKYSYPCQRLGIQSQKIRNRFDKPPATWTPTNINSSESQCV